MEFQFDFLEDELVLRMASGTERSLALTPRTVADFYREFRKKLESAGNEVKIWRMPVEVPNPIPFDEDTVHAAYDADAVRRFWRILLSVQVVFQEFRSRFIGKCSPVHFFWGSFDLAVTRFSGRRAPDRPGADAMTREAYSHEVSSVGFWPGMGLGEAAFHSYMAPEPEGFSEFPARPKAAGYESQLHEFILKYDSVRTAKSPSSDLLEFCESPTGPALRLASGTATCSSAGKQTRLEPCEETLWLLPARTSIQSPSQRQISTFARSA